MRRNPKSDEGSARREPRPPLPARVEANEPVAANGLITEEAGLTHAGLVEALRAIDGLVDVGRDPPNFHFCDRPFLHFHDEAGRTYADVRFGHDFEPVWASTPTERSELLSLVVEHIEERFRARKPKRSRRG